jgi:ActR/RegA family two-component response regulator
MNQSRIQVLVVDDAPNWRNYLQAILAPMDCEVYTANTLEQGMDALSQRNYSLAIVDVRLAEGDSLDVSGLSIVKEAWAKRAITRFVVLSGYPVETQVRSELNEIPYRIFNKADVTSPHFDDAIRNLINEARSDDR